MVTKVSEPAGSVMPIWFESVAMARELLTAALQLPATNLADRARALNGLAAFCLADEDYEANLVCHAEGLTLRRELNDADGIATVLHNMGLTAIITGDYERAMAWLDESVVVCPDCDPTSAWAHMGLIAQETQDLPAARRWLEMAYARTTTTPAGWMQAFVMNYLADVLREMGEYDEATRLAEESLRYFTELEDSYYLPDAQLTLAQIALDRGDYDAAAGLAALAGEQYEARDDAAFMAGVLLIQAELARIDGRPDAATLLLERSRTLRRCCAEP